MSQEKPKWDGTSRVSNDNYRKRWNEIFNKKGSVVNTDESFKSKDYSTFFATDPNNEEYE
jgi:hypothetical protein|tara:strand:- start:9 stop:188 length:180 start_codon:yes stop_codon:yes gene_type:complete